MATPTEHGDVWLGEADKRRPLVVVSRDDPHGTRGRATLATITTTIRGIPSEVVLDHRDGFQTTSAINCDELVTLPKSRLVRRVGRLSDEKLEAMHAALAFALQLD